MGVLLAGCSPTSLLVEPPPAVVAVDVPEVEGEDPDLNIDASSAPVGSVLTGDMAVRSRLGRAHEDWRGTPYRFGGTARSGIDCSAFVQKVYTESFAMALSRSTSTQVREGQEVRRGDLRPGDLVFFRTGRRMRHVGIYLGNNQFLHASTQRGVTVDTLNGYYDRTYWTARRVLRSDHLAHITTEEEQRRALMAATGRSSTSSLPPPTTPAGSQSAAPSNGDFPDRRSGW